MRHSPQESPDKTADPPADAEEPAAEVPADEPATPAAPEHPPQQNGLLTQKVGFPKWFLYVELMTVLPKRWKNVKDTY